MSTEYTPISILAEIAPAGRVDQSPNDTTISAIAGELHLRQSWTPDGIITLDRSTEKEKIIRKAKEKQLTIVEHLTELALYLEATALSHKLNTQVTFPNVQEYIHFVDAESKEKHPEYFEEQWIAGIGASLVKHWRRRAVLLQSENFTWESFLDGTFSFPAQYLVEKPLFCMDESGDKLLDTRDIKKTITVSEVEKHRKFTREGFFSSMSKHYLPHLKSAGNNLSSGVVLTHTATLPTLSAIVKDGMLTAERVNFCDGGIVRGPVIGAGEQASLLFDFSDLLEVIPLVRGDSVEPGENEITSYFPVLIEFVRGIINPNIVDKHNASYFVNTHAFEAAKIM